MDREKLPAISYAVLAAAFYALNMPVSKLLLEHIGPTFMAAFLYLGAGLGVGLVYLLFPRREGREKLTRQDLPYTLGMILLDIAAPILLMLGLTTAPSASASLLNNFEIVATTLIALVIFRELVSPRLWFGIALITLSSVLLSLEDLSALAFSPGSLLILGATVCWGLENNCTRQLAHKSTYEIVILKGIFSGLGSLLVALLRRESFQAAYLPPALALGFVAYGLSIFFYIRAQKTLGAAKTSAYYAIAPFVGALLSFALLREPLARHYGPALLLMAVGSAVVVMDTLAVSHSHAHTHTVTHTHDGVTHTHTVTHSHPHEHLPGGQAHTHHHRDSVFHQA